MKLLIRLSLFALIPTILFAIVNPIICLKNECIKTNPLVLVIYIFILSFSLTIILFTVIAMSRYASIIDKLDEAIKETHKEKEELKTLIIGYNDLIQENLLTKQ